VTFAGAVPGPDGQPLDQIRITGVSATGRHGVLAHERAEGQLFRADVVLHVDTRAAAASDDLDATVSYADVAQDMHAVLAGSPADLVETVAERIAAAAMAYGAVQAVDVRVHKPQAPISVPFDDVEIAIRRDRVRVPVVAPEAAEPDPVHPDRGGDQGFAPAAASSALPPVVPVATAGAPEEPAYVPDEAHGPGETTIGAFSLPPAPVPQTPEPATSPMAGPESGAVPAPVYEVTHTPAPEPAPEQPVDPLDNPPDTPVEVVIALGANLGDAQATLRTAVTDIDRIPGLQVTEVSPLARTAAVGGPEQPDFLNAVLLARTTLSPRDLLHACQAVEAQHGRVREEHWGPRTLDVDIVQYGTTTASADDLELPHPRARERAFVLVPWAEVAPHAVLLGLGGGPVAQLAATAPDRTGIRWLALDWLTDAAPTAAPAEQPAPAGPPSAPTPEHGAPVQVSPQQTAPQQTPPPSIPPTPPHGVMPPEPSHGTPQWHEPVPPAPEQQLAPVAEPPFQVPDEQQLPPISDVPFHVSAPQPMRPVAEEQFPPSSPLPVRRATEIPFPTPPQAPQAFAPVSEDPFPTPPTAPQAFAPVTQDPFPTPPQAPQAFAPLPADPFPTPPQAPQAFAPVPDNPFPTPPTPPQAFAPVTDSPFAPPPDHPFPPSGHVPGSDERR
jgi:dihydroneopterin aldolase/2-amino-4-hydroxy-6-hydroxymethyldihydropteridine diphosphokinase